MKARNSFDYLTTLLKIRYLRMKLLESTRFEAINSALSIKTGDSKIFGR